MNTNTVTLRGKLASIRDGDGESTELLVLVRTPQRVDVIPVTITADTSTDFYPDAPDIGTKLTVTGRLQRRSTNGMAGSLSVTADTARLGWAATFADIAEDAAAKLPVAIMAVADLDADMWHDLGPHMTCSEYAAIRDLLQVIGAVGAIEMLDTGHENGDNQPGDCMFTCDACDGKGWLVIIAADAYDIGTVDQTTGQADFEPVARCDNCQQFPSDMDAAYAAAPALEGEVLFVESHDWRGGVGGQSHNPNGQWWIAKGTQ